MAPPIGSSVNHEDSDWEYRECALGDPVGPSDRDGAHRKVGFRLLLVRELTDKEGAAEPWKTPILYGERELFGCADAHSSRVASRRV